ncbi:arylamine N-acetyltransferase family protein [Telluribacter humicola]|uniref:arylamine N-acetyltransferase family protein n=1 Tax=Telluribacter humicola TaxID=1720261 RepID=UPI001A97CA36|nr:arylamine N-acetyltransferase [Telluribacter humicola]
MKTLSAYLNRINYTATPTISVETLVALHRAHTLTVPFENLDIINAIPIQLDQQQFYHKIVGHNRGGFCYELNGLFKLLLDQIGFRSWFISCNVYSPRIGGFAPDFGHLAIIAEVEDKLYLVDVGFGDAFIEPLKLEFDTHQNQFGSYYRLTRLPDEEVLQEKSSDGNSYSKLFKFTLKARELSEFEQLCQMHQHSPQAPFNKQPLCSRPTLDGRITLTSKSLTTTRHGVKQEIPITSDTEFQQTLSDLFGIAWETKAAVII